MTTQRLSEATIAATLAIIEEALAAGFKPPGMEGGGKGAVRQAAEWAIERGMVNTIAGFKTRFENAATRGFHPDWSLYRRPEETIGYVSHQHPDVRHDPPETAYAPEEEPRRVVVIGDLHADPRQNLRRCTWIGRFIAERRAPHVVQIGDFGSWDSVSAHEVKGSAGAAARPSVDQDFAANGEALRLLQKEQPDDYKPMKDITYGNHEDRLRRYENLNPELGQHLSLRLDEQFARYGWRTRSFGEHRYIGGVAFTHAPLNGVGRAYGGKTGSMRAGNDSLIDIVHGHDHLRTVATIPKTGGRGSVQIVSVGCALEWGWKEPYAKTGPGGWWWGVTELSVSGGHIHSIDFVDMHTLRQRYSDDGGDVQAA